MKAAVLVSRGRLEIQDLPIPALEPEAVLVKVEAVGICNATDARILNAPDPTKVWPYQAWPQVMGHETCGRILEVGAQVTGWKVGDRIAGWCPRQGGFAEQCLVYPGRIAAVKVPTGMPSVTASTLELALGTARFFLREEARRRLEGAESAYIAGLGPAGLMYLMECLCLGYKKVYVSGNQESRRALARELGATEVFRPEDRPAAVLAGRGVSVDLGIDTTGADVSADFLRVVRKGGVLFPFGVGFDWKARKADLDARDIFLTDAAHKEAGEVAPRIVDWILSGKMPVGRLVTRVIPLDEIAEGFARIARREEIKVVVRP